MNAQSQVSLNEQLAQLRYIAVMNGLYDAADFIQDVLLNRVAAGAASERPTQ